MFRHVEDVITKPLQNTLLQVASHDKSWITIDSVQEIDSIKLSYRAYPKHRKDQWIRAYYENGPDIFSLLTLSRWLVDGPKVFRPTVEQAAALEQVEARLTILDYAQPFPAILIDLPLGYEPFQSVCCHLNDREITNFRILSLLLVTQDHKDDICNTIFEKRETPNNFMEVHLNYYEHDCSDLAKQAARACRVAVNSCLCLANFPTLVDYLYPKEVQSDERLAKEDSERGVRARQRLQVASQLVRFEKDVMLYRTAVRKNESGEETGRKVHWHWRRGHWAMQPFGPNNSLRKRILRKPVLINADQIATGDIPKHTTIYKA